MSIWGIADTPPVITANYAHGCSFTRMPYTYNDLTTACTRIMGYQSQLRLPVRVLVAETDGLDDGRSSWSPSMRVVRQAVYDMNTYGAFIFK